MTSPIATDRACDCGDLTGGSSGRKRRPMTRRWHLQRLRRSPRRRPAAPDATSSDEDAPSLELPDDTHDEGHEDPIAKFPSWKRGFRPDAGVGGQPAAAGHCWRLHRPRILRDRGERLGHHPQSRERLLPAIRRQVWLGVPRRHPGDPPSTRAARWPIWAMPPARRRATTHSLRRRARLHRQRDQHEADLRPGPSAIATASLNFTPRTGSNFSLGDVFDADIAQLEWMPTRSQKTSIFVGKFDSVLGIEYRERKSDQRYGITPSLIARYTTGTAMGVKVRSKFGPDDLLVLAGAVTNGSFTTEQFFFYNETDTNLGKTVSGRISLHPPFPLDMELGTSGSYGPQDRSPNDVGKMWFWGVDYQLHLRRADLRAEYLRGASPAMRSTRSTACSSTAAATSSWRPTAAALRRDRAHRVPRRLHLAGRSQRAGRRRSRLPDQGLARHRAGSTSTSPIGSFSSRVSPQR